MQLVSIYWSPSETKDQFENFIKILELNLEHFSNKSPFLIVVLGDFNARMEGWYQSDITTFEGVRFKPKIKEPTHILSNSASSIVLRSGSYLPKKNFFISFNDSPSKMMKNAFYFILKALFALKIFKFLSWLSGQVEKTAWFER